VTLTRVLIGLTASLGMGLALYWLAVSRPDWVPMVVTLIVAGLLGQLLLDLDRRRRRQSVARQRWETINTTRPRQG
jgi:hypothetical protein